jgi:hypothetical protein
MNLVDQVPVGLLHVLEADIAQDTGIVDQHVDATKVVDGRLDNEITILDRVVVCDRLAACGANLLNDCIRRLFTTVSQIMGALRESWG